MKYILAAICTVFSGFVGIWFGAYLDMAQAGGIIFSIACMGGFLLSAIDDKKN